MVANVLLRPGAPVDGVAAWDLNGDRVHDGLDWFCQNVTTVIGRLFLRLMFMVVLPLVVSALALAVVEIGDVRKLGRIGLRTLLFSGILSASAVLLGLTLVNLIRPGDALSAEARQALVERNAAGSADVGQKASKAKSVRDIVIDMIPENPLQEMAGAIDGSSKGNGMLAVMFASLFLGAALAAKPAECRGVISFLEGLNSVAMTIIGWAMTLAPLGAGCLVFSIVATLGYEVLVTLAWFAVTVLLGLLLQLVVVYPLVLTLFSRVTPLAFFSKISEAMQVAFGTSSSNATLPTALRVAEQNLQLPRETARPAGPRSWHSARPSRQPAGRRDRGREGRTSPIPPALPASARFPLEPEKNSPSVRPTAEDKTAGGLDRSPPAAMRPVSSAGFEAQGVIHVHFQDHVSARCSHVGVPDGGGACR